MLTRVEFRLLMLNTLDLIWFSFGGLIGLFVALKPDRSIRILSYGKQGVADISPALVKFVRGCAVVVSIGSIYYLAHILLLNQ